MNDYLAEYAEFDWGTEYTQENYDVLPNEAIICQEYPSEVKFLQPQYSAEIQSLPESTSPGIVSNVLSFFGDLVQGAKQFISSGVEAVTRLPETLGVPSKAPKAPPTVKPKPSYTVYFIAGGIILFFLLILGMKK